MIKKVFIVAIMAMVAATNGFCQQPPTAIITGPKVADAGDLIVLDASASTGSSRLWIQAVAPTPKSFLPVDNGVRCVFATGTPGRYVFVLVVAGTGPNGNALAEIATHEIVVSGGTAPSDPTNPQQPPNQTPPISKKATKVTYVYEKDSNQVPREVSAALQALNEGGLIVASEFEKDTVSGSNQVPVQYRVALEHAMSVGLPALIVQSGEEVINTVKSPKTIEDVMTAVKGG